MHSNPHQRARSTDDAAATGDIARQAAHRVGAADWGPASPIQAAAAAPLWRALSHESAIWLLTPPPRRETHTNQRSLHVQ
jgi:hypothetical protein